MKKTIAVKKKKIDKKLSEQSEQTSGVTYVGLEKLRNEVRVLRREKEAIEKQVGLLEKKEKKRRGTPP